MDTILNKPENMLSNRPSIRVAVHVLLEPDRVDQLESGVKDLVALVQDIPSMSMKPLCDARPLQFGVTIFRATAFIMIVDLSDVVCYRRAKRRVEPSEYVTYDAVFWQLVPDGQLNHGLPTNNHAIVPI